VAASVAPAPKAASAPAADVPTSGRPGKYVIQVQALTDRAVAASLVKRLVDRGYPAFLVSPGAAGGSQYFKVQVGRYAQRPEAEGVKRRLQKEEQFTPWITQ
jgi:cell division septation protein DedD